MANEPSMDPLQELRDRLRQFAAARDWDQFHSLKNLAIALMIEAGELAEHFQWVPDAQVERVARIRHQKLADEAADVMLYLIRIADKLDIDLYEAACHKLEVNAVKYPVDRVKGDSRKYNEY